MTSQKKLEDVTIVHSTLLTTDNWKYANFQYFKCLAMMQQLRQVSLNFNKDLGLEEVSSCFQYLDTMDEVMTINQFCVYALSNLQVNRATSFMNHLLTILSEQRHFAYNLFDQLKQFQHCIFLLGSGGISQLVPFQLGSRIN